MKVNGLKLKTHLAIERIKRVFHTSRLHKDDQTGVLTVMPDLVLLDSRTKPDDWDEHHELIPNENNN